MAYALVQGDLEPDMLITLAAPGAQAALATAQAVNLDWLRPDGTRVTVPLVVVNAGLFQVKRVWVPGDSQVLGLHRARVVVTASNGEAASDPNDGTHLLWWVYPVPASTAFPPVTATIPPVQVGRYVAVGGETFFDVVLPSPRTDTNYNATATGADLTNQLTFACPTALYTQNGFRVIPSGALTTGDVVLWRAEELT